MAKKIEAYVDTSALIAFVDQSETFNRLFVRCFSNPPPLVTASLVVAEGHAWFLKRYDRFRAMQFLSMIEDMPFLKSVSVGKPEIEAATQVLRKFADQNLTVTDAVGLSIMHERRTRICWSTDHHLGLTGVPLVIHAA
jgi:predicted nucleic acid-binding protein